MGKLIKYEIRKQRASRMVIFVALAAALIMFWGGLLFENDMMMAISIMAMTFGAFLVLFYTGIESILVLNRDLRTKQSYMLWMLPKSSWEILGAKFISAILQMLIVFGVCGLAVGVSTALAVWKVAGFEKLAMAVKEFSWLFVEGGLKWTDLVLLALVLFLCWSLVIMVGFLAVIISRTLLVKSRFAGFLAVVLFFVINIVIEQLYAAINRFPGFDSLSGIGVTGWSIVDTIYYIIVAAAVFGLSGLLAEKKLSV